MASPQKSHYPGKVAIRHAVESARAAGLTVVGFEILPNGGIRIIDKAAQSTAPTDEFEAWDRSGKLG